MEVLGGRGSSSASASAAVVSFGSIKQHMQEAYGITVSDSLSGYPVETLQTAIDGIETVVKEFPGVVDFIHKIGHTDEKDTLASMSYGGTLRLGNSFKDAGILAADYEQTLKAHFHPKGTTARDITAHEVGHALETALTYKKYSDMPEFVIISMRSNRKVATQIVGEAAKRAKKTLEGKGKKIDDLVGHVSGYAKRNRSEALAECVADYVANGPNARVLSREVWGVLKEEFNK